MDKRDKTRATCPTDEPESLEDQQFKAIEEELRKRGDIHKLALLEAERLHRLEVQRKRTADEGRRRLARLGLGHGVFKQEQFEYDTRIRMARARMQKQSQMKQRQVHDPVRPRCAPIRIRLDVPEPGRSGSGSIWWFGMFGGLAMLVTALGTFAWKEAKARNTRFRQHQARLQARRAELERLRTDQKELSRQTVAKLARLVERTRTSLNDKRMNSGVGRVAAEPKKQKARRRTHRTTQSRHTRRTTGPRPVAGLSCNPDDPLCGT